MQITEKFAHSKDEACDLTAKGITGKSQKWFNEQFIIAGACTAPSLGTITFSGEITVEVGTALTTSQTLSQDDEAAEEDEPFIMCPGIM